MKYKMKPVEVLAWQFNGKFDDTASFSFSEWAKRFIPFRCVSFDNWIHKTFVIEVFMPTRNSTDWNTYECYYLEKNEWFVFHPYNDTFTVVSNKDFEKLYEKVNECIE